VPKTFDDVDGKQSRSVDDDTATPRVPPARALLRIARRGVTTREVTVGGAGEVAIAKTIAE
jgi:hypothetical protein|tara:strand:+ start:3996 stop:4178 length:183 start_codon:yes stop_codon:yes gene_type:complete